MKFNVHMLAFEETYRIRRVEVPKEKMIELSINGTIDDLLGLIFYYGQNDFQPQKCCSVSAGDVIEVSNKLYMILRMGFLPITTEQMSTYKACDRRKRSWFAISEEAFLTKFPA